MKRIPTVLLLLALVLPARADYVYRDGNGNLQVMKALTFGTAPNTSVQPQSTLVDITNNPVGTIANPLYVSGAAGGTASAYGVAFPTTGTAVGFYDPSGNMNYAKVDASHNLYVTGTFWPYALGHTVMSASVPVTIASDQTPFAISNISGTISLPTGAATAALQTTLLTNLGSPFQAGGNIGNTSFAATQATAANLNATVVGTGTFAVQAAQAGTWNVGITGTVSLPTGAATSALQSTTISTLGTPMQNSGGSVTANLGALNGAATAALQTTGNTALGTINTTLGSPMQNSGGSVTANLGTLNGAATAANQATIIADLGTILTNTNGILNPIPTQAPTISIGGVGIVDSAGTNVATVKAASTASVTADKSIIVQFNPVQPNLTTPLNVGLAAGSALAGKFGIDQTTQASTNAVVSVPTSAAGGGVAPVASSSIEACHVLKAAPGNLYSLTTTIGATSGWVLVFNATSAPSDGTVTPTWWFPIITNATFGGYAMSWSKPLYHSAGITACFSTTGPFTKTASATAQFSAGVQ